LPGLQGFAGQFSAHSEKQVNKIEPRGQRDPERHKLQEDNQPDNGVQVRIYNRIHRKRAIYQYAQAEDQAEPAAASKEDAKLRKPETKDSQDVLQPE